MYRSDRRGFMKDLLVAGGVSLAAVGAPGLYGCEVDDEYLLDRMCVQSPGTDMSAGEKKVSMDVIRNSKGSSPIPYRLSQEEGEHDLLQLAMDPKTDKEDSWIHVQGRESIWFNNGTIERRSSTNVDYSICDSVAEELRRSRHGSRKARITSYHTHLRDVIISWISKHHEHMDIACEAGQKMCRIPDYILELQSLPSPNDFHALSYLKKMVAERYPDVLEVVSGKVATPVGMFRYDVHGFYWYSTVEGFFSIDRIWDKAAEKGQKDWSVESAIEVFNKEGLCLSLDRADYSSAFFKNRAQENKVRRLQGMEIRAAIPGKKKR